MHLLALLTARGRSNLVKIQIFELVFIRLVVITAYLTNVLFCDDPIPSPYQPMASIVRLEAPNALADLCGDNPFPSPSQLVVF